MTCDLRITRHSASAHLVLLPSGVLAVHLHGPITVDALLHFKSVIVGQRHVQFGAIVTNFTEAAVALDGRDLDRVPASSLPGCTTLLPTALVVPAEWIEVFTMYALRVAARTVIRQVFLQPGLALRWAQAHAGRQQKTTSPGGFQTALKALLPPSAAAPADL